MDTRKTMRRVAFGAVAAGVLTLSGTAYASREPANEPDTEGARASSSSVADHSRRLPNANIAGPRGAKGAPDVGTAAVGCDTGTVHSFARVKGAAAGFPTIYTTSATFVDRPRNCSGGAISVRRASTGVYFVRFAGDTAVLALAQNNADGLGIESIMNDNIVTVARVTDTDGLQSFRVEIQDVCGDCSDGADPQNGQFTIMLF